MVSPVFLRLTKAPLCLLIGCSTLFGFLYHRPDRWLPGVAAAFFVFLLAAGGATFNSIQERHHDRAMSRTRNRPLVTGEVSVAVALGIGLILTACGFLLLWSVFSLFPALLGLFALLVYNGVYTPLKQFSILALIPGAVSGALPPVIGMVCGGAALVSYPVLLVFSLLFLWQFPHFLLVTLMHRSDYEPARLPTFYHYFSAARLKKFFVTWIGALAVVMMLFAAHSDCMARCCRILVLANSGAMVLVFLLISGRWTEQEAKKLFIALNLLLTLHMVIVTLGRMLC